MSGSSRLESAETSSNSSFCHRTAYSMLTTHLPTQKELKELCKEVEILRKDKKLKDDTIKFLQKEKEALMHELKYYEQLCEGVVSDVTSHRDLETQNKQLQADILHLKDVIRRQNSLLRNTGTSGSTLLDRQLVTRLCGNITSLLTDVNTAMSGQVCKEIEHQKETLERSTSKRGETTWHFLEIIDRAMIELKSQAKNGDLPDISKLASVPMYSQNGISNISNTLGSSNEPNTRLRKTNLTTTNSSSMANLSSNETLVMAGHARRRSSNNTGKLGRLGRLERSRSAPALNELVPRPPPSPAPPHAQNLYSKSERPLTAMVNMLDTLKDHPPAADYRY